jgi:6-phospho-beta-glucosidase
MHKLVFPNNFWWGAATSGPQSEGQFGKVHQNIFDYWYHVEPNAFYNQVGPTIASDFYNKFRDDLRQIQSIGLNSFRTSIQWTRLIKNFETGEIDEAGAKFYSDVIDECLKYKLTPVMNLNHFDLPIELYQKYGGWESKYVTDLFAIFAEKCFELYSDRVKYWMTMNEPIVVVEGGYLYKFHYPKLVDGKKAVQVIFNLNLASAKAIKVFRDKGFAAGGKIGIILNLTPSYACSNSSEDVAAADFADMFFNRSFLDPAVKGVFPEKLVEILKQDNVLWQANDEEMQIIAENTIDYLGINYYQPRRIQKKESSFIEVNGWMPDKYFDNYDMPGKRINPSKNWEIYPEAVYDIAINIRNNYKNIPWYLSENGMGVKDEEQFMNSGGMIEDDYRIDFVKEHLHYLHKGISAGANCFGYHMWTPIDCWSWCNAYRNRYGYISLNLKTMEKTVKKSGHWIQKVSHDNGFEL